MATKIVLGAQWGDEGKAKIVDFLTLDADIVVRFQGGHNAGHTLVVDGTTYKISLVPSGIVTGTLSLIGNGVVLDPWALKSEIEKLEGQGVKITADNFAVADNCPLILPLHRDLDGLRETAAGQGKIGTTGRGIGPAYEDKVGRRAIRVCDLAHLDEIEPQLDRLCAHHDALRAGFDEPPIDREQLIAELREIAPFVLQFAQPVWKRLKKVRKAGARILFEGAQGVLLDVDHGTYPFVTSSNTVSGTAASGSGLGPNATGFVLGITKAYTTRVGSGPFPTELTDEIGQGLGERGHEFGVVTGRKRRVGWFDAVLVRQAIKVGGIDGIALTKLDVLDGFDEIKVCVAYRLKGETIDHYPAGLTDQAAVEPVYETLQGWKGSTAGARSWADLPAEAVKYVRRLEELVGKPCALVSTSPEREDVILMKDPFEG